MELSGEIENIKLYEQIFKDIKFYVTGEIPDKVITLLKDGGAERMNYFSDYVTHLICGNNPEENDLSDANDLYEIPALTPKWIFMSARLKKLVNQKPYLYNPNKLFSNCVFCFSKINEDRNTLWAVISYNGGKVQLNLDKKCTHLITVTTDTAKYLKAMELGPDIIKVATPDWIIESVKNNGFAQIELYHPKLINWPKVTKYESTTAITGFEPPPTETEENLTEANLADSTTQALLDKLKQRMPWNQPQTSQSANDVIPPNVVAPTNTKIPQTPPTSATTPSSPTANNTSQLNSQQQPQQQQQQRFFNPTSQQLIQNPQHIAQFSNASQIQQNILTSNNQMPKSIVHHTPQGTIMNQPRPQLDVQQFKQSNQQVLQNVSQAQANQLIQNRLITQQQIQQRQHLLGQIGQINKLNQLSQMNQQNQFNQQLLQQQRAQGRPIGQPNVQISQSIGQPNVQISQSPQQPQPNQIVTINQQQINQNQQNLIQRMHLGQLSKNSVSMQQLNQQIQQHFANRQQNLNITQLSQNNQMQHLNITQQVSAPTQQINQQPQQQQLHQNQGSPYTSVSQSPQSINQVVLSSQNQQNINIQQNKLIQSHFNQNLQGQINQQQILTSQQQIVNLNQLRQKQFNQTQQFNDGSPRTLSGFPQQQPNQQQQQQQPQQQNQPVQSPQQNQLIQNQQIQNSSQNQLIQIQQQNQQQQNQLIQNQQQQQNQLLQNQQQSQQQTTQLITTQQQTQLIQNQQNQQQSNQLIQNQQQNQLIQNQQQNQIIQSPQPSQLVQTQQVQFVQTQQFNQNQQQLIAHSPQSTQNLIPQSPQQSNQYSQAQQSQFIQQNQQVQIQQQQQQKFVQSQNQMQSPQQSNQFMQNQQQTNQQQQPQAQIINQQINVNQQQLLINQQQNQTFQQQQQTTTSGNQFNQQLLQQLPHSSIANQPQNQLVNTQNIVSQNQITQQQIVQQNQLNQQNIPPQLAQQQQQLQNQQPNLVSQQNIPSQLVPTQQQPAIQINQPNIAGQQRPLGQNLWQQVGIRHATNVIHQQGAPRVQWPANHPQGGVIPQRQYIQLDAQTHQQLQQMAPEQRALFIAKLQRQRQLAIQQKQQQLQIQQHQQQQQQQQRHVVIRGGPVPPGLTPQQQMQWLQQQAKQQGVVLQQASIQQQAPPVATPNIPQGANVQPPNIQQPQQAPGLSPIQQQGTPQFTDHAQQQLQIQRQQQHFRLQQLQVQQREQQTPKPAPPIVQQEPPVVPQATIARPLAQPTETVPVSVVDANVAQQQLVVNAKTKTALANMLSIRLQSGGTNVGPVPETIAEPSAAGTLRLMTAQHNAALSSSGRPQDLMGLQQRRPIGAPTTELIRPPAAPSVPPPTVGEPPKLQYSPRSNLPLQHRPGPFYGHNPNLKLPPDLFLLGCIFVVVEVERFLEESMPNWKQKIEKYGGEVESQYCSRVTHVLCETQRHGVVMQALRDFKRCVTLYWLSDILKRKQVLPPWTALHLPTMYLDTAPASKHLVSLSGFVEPDRSKIKHMIKYIGATFTSYFSKHNTLLIAAKAEGEKFTRAKKWGTPVVNIQWLTDVMLGHFVALNQIEHMKYQQFPTPPVFTFDPALVPTLMQAWKMPINISQESYERVKRCVSPVTMPKKTKKIKTEASNDENENPENFGNPNATHKILFSGCQNVEELHKVVINLNGAIAKTTTECTHLVMSTLQRTNKLLHCLCLGNVHIVPDSWLWDSRNGGKFLDEINYTFDTKEFNSMYKCDFGQTLQTKNRNKLLEGKFFFITPSIYPNKKFLSELVQSCGGVVEKIRRTTSQIEATNISSPYSYIILTHENDLHLVYDVLRNKKNKVKIVCNVELLLSAILKQTFEVEPYTVKVL